MAWDSRVRGRGSVTKEVLQGSPLSPVLFLVYMAPILEGMEWRVKEEVGRGKVCFLSYGDDPHCGLYDSRRVGDAIDQGERMQDQVVRARWVVTEVPEEHGLPLAADKEESIVLRGGEGHTKRRNALVEKVKWLGVILDAYLKFVKHWKYRIGKVRVLLGALGGVENSRWGTNPLSWRAACTCMVRSVASWGVDIGWRGQKE